MFWDGLTIVLAVGLFISGWKRGFLSSLPSPVALVLATIITKYVYIDFAQVISAHLRLSPTVSVVASYVLLWLVIDTALELVLSMFIRGRFVEHTPIVINQFFGGVWGLAKAITIILLPMMAISVDIKIPDPPADSSGLIAPQIPAETDSSFLPVFHNMAEALDPIIGKYVVSTDAPSFTPEYETRPEEEKKKN